MSANSKFTKGYATSGVVLAIDARHGFILPQGVGDLQKGERYVVIDDCSTSPVTDQDSRV